MVILLESIMTLLLKLRLLAVFFLGSIITHYFAFFYQVLLFLKEGAGSKIKLVKAKKERKVISVYLRLFSCISLLSKSYMVRSAGIEPAAFSSGG